MSLSVLPFSLHLPTGFSLSAASVASAGSIAATGSVTSIVPASAASAPTPPGNSPSSAPIADVVSIGTASNAGTFTAVAGDVLSLSALFQGQGGATNPVMGYRLALGAGDGQLSLNGADVSARTSFTADEFAHLSYTVGADGTRQSIAAVAQTGKRLSDGTLSQLVDSPAVQITADVTGTRSIDAMAALRTVPPGPDADTIGIVKEAAILTGAFGAAQPTLQSSGNFTAVAGDSFRLGDLFHGTAATGKTIAGYRLALGAGDGQLTLNGADVSGRTNFTADEFAHLSYTAGADGTQQSLTVVAQIGIRLNDGTLSQAVDSHAMRITADVTGTRSINAMGALSTVPSGADANTVIVVKESTILVGGFGSAQPTLQTDGNFTAAAGDAFRLGDLFQGSAPTGKTIAGYRLALGDGGGQLTLNGADVSDRTSFTADEFAHLSYTSGPGGSQQSLVVVAQTGVRLKDGTLSQVVDSAAVQIAADVTGTRSINAMNALSTVVSGPDANTVGVVKEAAILSGSFGSARPTLQTQGNFTAAEGDVFRMSDLFSAGSATGKTIAGFRLALGAGGGTLTLNGADVSDRTSFTADEFAHLSYTASAGADGTRQSLTVVAQTGIRLSNGTLSQIADSQPVQITADVTGARSINAMAALITEPTGADAATIGVVKESAILTGGFGAGQPALQTDGNFSAVAGDVFSVGDLFHAGAPAGKTIAGYRLALGDGGGQLTLNGADVSDRTSFTADEFAHLSYTAGADGTQQDLTVAAQTGIRLKDGTLSQVVDSPAMQITSGVTGVRSVNTMGALRTAPPDADFNTVSIVKEAAILTGGFGSARPTLQSVVTSEPALSPATLSTAIGAYSSAGLTTAGSATNLASLYQDAVGSSGAPGIFSNPGGPLAVAVLLLDADAPGAFRMANNLAAQSVAIKAYNSSGGP